MVSRLVGLFDAAAADTEGGDATVIHLAAYDQSLMVAVWCVLGMFGPDCAAAVQRLSARVTVSCYVFPLGNVRAWGVTWVRSMLQGTFLCVLRRHVPPQELLH